MKIKKVITWKRREYKSTLQLQQYITKVWNDSQYIDPDTGLFLLSPALFRNILGISNKQLRKWEQSTNPDELKRAELMAECIDFLCANITQEMLQNPKNAYYRLPILKAYALDFKEQGDQEQQNTKAQINITIDKDSPTGLQKFRTAPSKKGNNEIHSEPN